MSPAPAHDATTAAGPARDLSWLERREWFRARLDQQRPDKITAEEIEVHFSAMPPYYWERVTESDLVWGLEAIHGFLRLVASPRVPATTLFVSWRQTSPPDGTRVMLCTWDRHGLVAKAAAAFSAVRLNILRADVFTRADNLVLDEFSVTHADTGGHGAVSEARLQEMAFLLDGALSEPPRFASVWACSRHKYLAAPSRVAPQITFDNQSSADETLVHIAAEDRLGLLYDILQAIADAGLDIKHARIETEGNRARDSIHVTDERGQKVLDARRLEALRTRLGAALIPND